MTRIRCDKNYVCDLGCRIGLQHLWRKHGHAMIWIAWCGYTSLFVFVDRFFMAGEEEFQAGSGWEPESVYNWFSSVFVRTWYLYRWIQLNSSRFTSDIITSWRFYMFLYIYRFFTTNNCECIALIAVFNDVFSNLHHGSFIHLTATLMTTQFVSRFIFDSKPNETVSRHRIWKTLSRRPADLLWDPGLDPGQGRAFRAFRSYVTKPAGVQQGSLNYLFEGNQTMQMYGNFEGFPLTTALFGLVVWWPLYKELPGTHAALHWVVAALLSGRIVEHSRGESKQPKRGPRDSLFEQHNTL